MKVTVLMIRGTDINLLVPPLLRPYAVVFGEKILLVFDTGWDGDKQRDIAITHLVKAGVAYGKTEIAVVG